MGLARSHILADPFLPEMCLHFSDMDTQSPRLKALILDRVGQGVAGAVWTSTDFLDLGRRDAVDKTLQRLVKWGELRRIDRRLYDKPRFISLTQQQSAPDPRAVIDAVARRDQIRVPVDGMSHASITLAKCACGILRNRTSLPEGSRSTRRICAPQIATGRSKA